MTAREERAREVLAEHAERYGYPLAAKSIRAGDDPWFYTVCAKAMLSFADQPLAGEDGVTDADRKAAAPFMRTDWARNEMLRGQRDDDDRVQAFALHRRAAFAAGMMRAAEIARTAVTYVVGEQRDLCDRIATAIRQEVGR